MPFISFLQGILSDIVKCIGDNRKQMRECTLAALDSWVAATHLEKMVGVFIILYVFVLFIFVMFIDRDNSIDSWSSFRYHILLLL